MHDVKVGDCTPRLSSKGLMDMCKRSNDWKYRALTSEYANKIHNIIEITLLVFIYLLTRGN